MAQEATSNEPEFDYLNKAAAIRPAHKSAARVDASAAARAGPPDVLPSKKLPHRLAALGLLVAHAAAARHAIGLRARGLATTLRSGPLPTDGAALGSV